MTTRRIRRILHSRDPRGEDYRNAQEWVEEIRSRLGHIRGELHDIGRIEASFPHDRLCDEVAGSLSLAIIALHRLVEGERSFNHRADKVDELWEAVAALPEDYLIKDDSSWDWRPWGIFKRLGR